MYNYNLEKFLQNLNLKFPYFFHPRGSILEGGGGEIGAKLRDSSFKKKKKNEITETQRERIPPPVAGADRANNSALE